MLEAILPHYRKCNPDSRMGEGKLYQLKKCRRQVVSQYSRAAQSYSEQEKQLKKSDLKLEEAITVLKKEKGEVEKSLQEALLLQDKAIWEKTTLERVLKQQQQQRTICQGQKEQKEEHQNLLRRENLLQLKERDATAHNKSSLEAAQQAITQKSRALEGQILNAMKSIQAKTEINRQLSGQLEGLEKDSMKAIEAINNLDERIETNTLTIQRRLTTQSSLANYYGQLKRSKKQLHIKVSQMGCEVQHEQAITAQLYEVEQTLNEALRQIHTGINEEHVQIDKLKSENTSQKKEVAKNKQCLIKLQLYLENLKSQNERIELYMQHVVEEDQRIKAAIDRKHSRPSPSSSWRGQSSPDKSMGSTFA